MLKIFWSLLICWLCWLSSINGSYSCLNLTSQLWSDFKLSYIDCPPLCITLLTLTFCKFIFNSLFSYYSFWALACYFFRIYYSFVILSIISCCSKEFSTTLFFRILFLLVDEFSDIDLSIWLGNSSATSELFTD